MDSLCQLIKTAAYMDWLFDLNWQEIFGVETSPIEIFIRGSCIYFILFCILRFLHSRQAGSIGISDLLVVVLMADAAQNGMSADYKTIPEAALLIMTIIGWNFSLEWLGYRYPKIGRIIHPQPLPLVKNGRMIHRNMRREFITPQELMSQIREQGVAKMSDVKTACLEGDGKISVVPKRAGRNDF